MPDPLNIVIVEDSADDAALLVHELEESGFDPRWRRVETRDGFASALAPDVDLICSDFSLPQFSVQGALEILHRSGLDIPFIIVSGTIGEERAVESMRAGATDYVLKDHRHRLGPAVRRALREHRERRERQKAERELRRAHEELRHLLEHSPAVLYTLRLDGRTVVPTLVSANIERILGVPPAAVDREWWHASLHPEDRDRVLAAVGGAIEAGGYTLVYRFRHSDGDYRWIEDTTRPIRDPQGTNVALVGAWRDITEQRQLEAQLRQAQKLEAIGTLAGGIAHDFNNILGAIIGYIELARLEPHVPEDVLDCLNQIFKAAGRAKDLVRNILTFSRQQEQQLMPVQLRHVVAEALKLLRAGTPSTIQFETALEPDAPSVLADPSQIHQIVMNLGTNAAYAMRGAPGVLAIRLERVLIEPGAPAASRLKPGAYARLTFRDNGCGMDLETQQRIFEPFFTTKPPGEGTGLGLPTVHGIVRSCGGGIEVFSEPGQGTSFVLHFPAVAETEMPLEPADGQIPLGRGEHILLVEDEPMLLELGRQVLERLGYRVSTAARPSIALGQFLENPDAFALVITDLTMPELTGLDFGKALLRIRPRLPILLTTGYGGNITRASAKAAGLRELIYKPMTIQNTAKVIHELLHASAAS